MKEVVRSRTPMKETTVEIWMHPQPQVWIKILHSSFLSPFIDFYECIRNILKSCFSMWVTWSFIRRFCAGLQSDNMTVNTYFFLVWFDDNNGVSLFVGSGISIPEKILSKWLLILLMFVYFWDHMLKKVENFCFIIWLKCKV